MSLFFVSIPGRSVEPEKNKDGFVEALSAAAEEAAAQDYFPYHLPKHTDISAKYNRATFNIISYFSRETDFILNYGHVYGLKVCARGMVGMIAAAIAAGQKDPSLVLEAAIDERSISLLTDIASKGESTGKGRYSYRATQMESMLGYKSDDRYPSDEERDRLLSGMEYDDEAGIFVPARHVQEGFGRLAKGDSHEGRCHMLSHLGQIFTVMATNLATGPQLLPFDLQDEETATCVQEARERVLS